MKSILFTCRHNLKLYGRLQIMNIRSITQYRADFFLMLCFTLFSQLCSLSVIGIIYTNIPQIAGWTLWETLVFMRQKSLIASKGGRCVIKISN